jgi:protein-disulfide isomerase
MEEDKHLTKRERKKLAKKEKKKEREKTDKVKDLRTYVIWAIVIVVVIFGGLKLINWINTPTVEIVSEPVEVTEDDWTKGAENAEITIIEYSDFQCPACKSYYPIINRLGDELSDSVRVVYRHFPLVSIHHNAFDAARAAEAAGRQGKFWDMHDLLFENQDEWSNDGSPKDKFIDYANELELDEESFKNDYESSEVEDKINEHIFQANRLGINSTPSFVLNDQLIQNPRGYEAFKTLVEENLNSE